MRRQALTWKEGLEVLAQICDGLGFAHANRIVHRDIKPANIRVVRDGQRLQAKVMDFGVARIGDAGMTATGMVMGTVSYMAPEYIRSGVPDPRNDLFAVGVMLYEILSGRKPFSGDTTPTILYKIVNEAPDPLDLSQLQGISPAIRSVLDRALDKDPERRHQTAEELAKALRAAKDPTWNGQAVQGTVQLQAAAAPTVIEAQAPAPPPLPPPASPEPAPPKAHLPAPRPRKSGGFGLAIGLAAVALLVVAAGGWAAWRWKQAPAPAQVATASGAAMDPLPADPAHPAAQSTGFSSPARTAARQPGIAQVDANHEDGQRPAIQATAPVDELANLDGPGRRNLGMSLLSEGSALVESDSSRALEILRRSIRANPYDPRPYALAAAVLYGQERYDECRDVLRRARTAHLSRSQLLDANLKFRMAMDKDSYVHRVDGELD
jgi:serine/threonine-protein kinase